jgi:putative Holliday junction resolvase
VDARFFQQLVRQEGITMFVVGLPVFASGDESPISRDARAFGNWLQLQTGLPTVFFDERYSSQEADNLLHLGKLSRAKRKARRDMLAAQILLTAFLESSHPHDAPKALDES